MIRMYAHSFEWAGYANYTKGIPKYQKEMTTANKFTYYGTSELGGRVYFTGFNEEGFAVSPRGIEDIQTGEVLSQEQIDAPDQGLTVPDNLQALTVADLSVTNELNLNSSNIIGNPNWGTTLPVAATDVAGIVKLATVPDAIEGTNTEEINYSCSIGQQDYSTDECNQCEHPDRHSCYDCQQCS